MPRGMGLPLPLDARDHPSHFTLAGGICDLASGDKYRACRQTLLACLHDNFLAPYGRLKIAFSNFTHYPQHI